MAAGVRPGVRPSGGGVRTSATHPMTLSWVVPAEDGKGGLGLHFCPGKEVC
jgi:hypothetical protein